MRNVAVLSLLFFLLLSSCGHSNVERKKAWAFFDSVHAQITLNKPAQQKFIDKSTEAIRMIKENPDVIIDTKELQLLLDVAKEKNIQREKNINEIEEVDNSINYKQKTLDYVKTFNDAFQNEFPKFIQILALQKEDRLQKSMELVYPKLKLIKDKEIEMKDAQDDFEAKYGGANTAESKRTPGDYEFVKLKDFTFSPASIKDGAKIELLSFSGGRQNTDDKIYYKQFIGVDMANGDTLRILAFAAMQRYSFDKAPRIGTFKSYLPNRTDLTPSDNEYIIFNTNQAYIEKGNYKTAFGILSFEE